MRCFIILLFVFLSGVFSPLSAQVELEAIGVWDSGIYTELCCRNLNRCGSSIDNDYYDDYLQIAAGDNFVQFYMGSSTLNTTFDNELLGVINSGNLSWGGDLNADGYNDIVWSVHNDWGDAGDIYICMGGEEIDIEPELILHGEDYVIDGYSLGYFGINGNYDFNGDGIDDLFTKGIGPSLWWNGLIQIFFGDSDFSSQPDIQSQGNVEDFLSNYIAAGDFNGDGYDDLAASRSINADMACQLEIYMGSEFMDLACDYIVPDTLYLDNETILPAADVNRDGRDEIILYSADGIRLYNINSSEELVAEDINIELDGKRLTADINGDSVGDIVCWNQQEGLIVVYYGGETINYNYDAYLEVPEVFSNASYNFFCSIGDVNGDGEDEILVNNVDDEGYLTNTATIYGLPGNGNSSPDIIPSEYSISNFPNPFNPETNFVFNIPRTQHVKLNIYNMKGQIIKVLIDETKPAGINSIIWNGKDEFSKNVGSGIYLARLITDSAEVSKKVILIK